MKFAIKGQLDLSVSLLVLEREEWRTVSHTGTANIRLSHTNLNIVRDRESSFVSGLLFLILEEF